MVNKYRGGKKRAYHNALVKLLQYGRLKSHYNISMFIKPDKYPLDEIHDAVPRAIQFRSKEFNLQMMQYVDPIEHRLYQELTMGSASGTRVIAKGLNPQERGDLILTKLKFFSRPRIYSLDHSRFDSCVRTEHLRMLHRKYYRMTRSYDFMKLCSHQLFNNCYSLRGIKYRARATRMSGDADTGLGNTIINLDVIYGWLLANGVDKYDMLVDGDDSWVIIEDQEMDNRYFSHMGFVTKVKSSLNTDDLQFCQQKLSMEPVSFVRNPQRILAHSSLCRRTYHMSQYPRWLTAVGMCELALGGGIPFVQEYAKKLITGNNPLYDEDIRFKMMDLEPKEKKVTLSAREQQYRLFGLDMNVTRFLETSMCNAVTICEVRGPGLCHDDEAIHTTRIYESILQPSGGSWWSCS